MSTYDRLASELRRPFLDLPDAVILAFWSGLSLGLVLGAGFAAGVLS